MNNQHHYNWRLWTLFKKKRKKKAKIQQQKSSPNNNHRQKSRPLVNTGNEYQPGAKTVSSRHVNCRQQNITHALLGLTPSQFVPNPSSTMTTHIMLVN